MSDIENFLCNPLHSKGILLFPPVNNYRRFLTHKLIEESFSQYNLQTLSVGKYSGRRTAVFVRSLLRRDYKPSVKVANQVSHRRASLLASPMVNKNGDKLKQRTPYGGIYRPPAVRRLLHSKPEELDGTYDTQLTEAFPTPPTVATTVRSHVTAVKPQIVAAPSQLKVTTETHQSIAAPVQPTFTDTAPLVPCSSEKKSTRVKRPDQQMYVPRPKRLSSKDKDDVSLDRTDKSEPQHNNKVFISEKRNRLKVRKKSVDNEENESKEECCAAGFPETIADKTFESPAEESVASIPEVNQSACEISVCQLSLSLDNSFVFDSSQSKLSEISTEPIDSSFQTCADISFSVESENSHVSDIELSDSSPSIESCLQSSEDRLSSDLDSSNSVPEQKIPASIDSNPKVPPAAESVAGKDILINNSEIKSNCETTESSTKRNVEDANCSVETSNSSFVSISSANDSCGDLANFNESTDDSKCLNVSEFLDTSTESVDSPIKRRIRERIFAKSPEAVADDWELLLNENGQLLDPSLLKELEDAVGKVSISRPTCDYKEYQTIEERTSDGECIIEIYGFAAELRTHDLMNILSPLCGKNFQIAWVDDTHALGVFSSPLIADELLSTELPFIRTRPLSEGIPESRAKARKLVLPPMTRPKTCPALARRLVTGALGLRLPTSKLEREAERKVLKEARDKKRQEAKIKRDIWEGNEGQ